MRASAPQSRSTSNMREGFCSISPRASFLPDPLRHQGIDLALLDHLSHQRHWFRRHA
jgi:hypothetical protein